jgi:hypothetical protein
MYDITANSIWNSANRVRDCGWIQARNNLTETEHTGPYKYILELQCPMEVLRILASGYISHDFNFKLLSCAY